MQTDLHRDYGAKLGLYIDGEWLTGCDRPTAEVLDPATGGTLAALPLASASDLDRALEAAERGFRLWRETPAERRAAILLATAVLIRQRADRLARVATLEQGKPLAEARVEVEASAAILEFHAGETQRIYGRVLQRPLGSRSMVLQQPVGPVVAFCPWNFPIMNVVRKIAPALAAGCSIILKPSEETPGSAVEIFRCFEEAGLPGAVAHCVFGVPDIVSRHLLASPITRKLSFTGSVPVGKHLARLAADGMMRATLELGGHAPVLVFDDCDVDYTVETLVKHKFRNAGQVCISPTRFYVQDGVYDRFTKAFATRAARLAVGDGLDAGSQMGPMANPRGPLSIAALLEDARTGGARLLTGGEPIAQAGGFFFQPTVLADVPVTARAMNEEPFGPLALLTPFSTVDEAVTHANRLPFGLASYCFTENGRRQNLLAEALESGMVAINSVRLSWADSPFGGMKDSGFGSEDGPEGVAAHLVTKSVHIG